MTPEIAIFQLVVVWFVIGVAILASLLIFYRQKLMRYEWYFRNIEMRLWCVEDFFQDTLPGFISDCLPDWLVYRALIRAGAYGTTGKYGATVVPEVRFMTIVKRWSLK